MSGHESVRLAGSSCKYPACDRDGSDGGVVKEKREKKQKDPTLMFSERRRFVGQASEATDMSANGRNIVILSGNKLQVNIGSISPNHIVKWQGIILIAIMALSSPLAGGDVLKVLFGAWLLKELLPEFLKS